jgi:two-component system response regulator YesN
MPGMNGLDVMRKIKEENINCKIIILSSFDDIEHVKEAMKLGAVDYLHKPRMNSQDILNALINVKKLIEKEKISENDLPALNSSKENQHILKDVFLKDLIDGKDISNLEFNEKCKENKIKLENNNFNCIVFSVSNYKEVQKRYTESNKNLLQFSIFNIMNEILANEDGAEFLPYDKNLYVIITSSNSIISQQKAIENINTLIHLMLDAMEQFLNIDIIIGVSDIFNCHNEIKDAFVQANTALKHKFYLNEKKVIHYRDIKQNKNQDLLLYVDSLVKKLKSCLSNHNYDEFDTVLKELVNFLKREACLSEGEVKKLFNGFLFLIEESQSCLAAMEIINECESLETLYSVYKKLIKDRLYKFQADTQYQNCSYLIKKIIKFIEENYDQEITLSLLSENLNVSPNYISRLFKEETGQALFDYINEVRIQKAKRLLEDGELRIYEIGYKVGFKSPVHFNIVFNKFIGISPKQYRDNHKN